MKAIVKINSDRIIIDLTDDEGIVVDRIAVSSVNIEVEKPVIPKVRGRNLPAGRFYE